MGKAQLPKLTRCECKASYRSCQDVGKALDLLKYNRAIILVYAKTHLLHDSLLGLTVAIIFISLTDSSSALGQLSQQTFTTQMSGGEEVPSVSTTATGTAEFNLGSGGIDYQVSVTGVSNVTSISIDSGNVGENGPVIVTLFEPNASADLSNDVRFEGTITSADLEGPMQGKEISDLVSAMGSGVTYVNVHTQANPDGEIRGQI